MVMMDERNAYQPQGSAAIPTSGQQQQQPQGIGNGAQTINPTAQQVGQEFVRQYYTMFSQKPDQLHRFYTEASTFVRGVWDAQHAATEDQQQTGGIAGERVRLTGQTAVQNYMLNLKPRSGHARIHMVEAQPSHNDAVVVQVCGELRINEGPFRRFFQTFVLVPSGSRRFSVLNDIFVFQEEVLEAEADEDQGLQINGTAHLDEVVPPAPQPSVTTGPFPTTQAAPMPPREYSTSPAVEEPHTSSSLGNSQYTSPEPPQIFAGNQKETAPLKTEVGAHPADATAGGHPAEPVTGEPPAGPQTWAGIAKNLPNHRKDGASSAQGMAPPPSSIAPLSPPMANNADRPPVGPGQPGGPGTGAPNASHATREYVNQTRNKAPPVHRASIGSDAGGSSVGGAGYVRGPWDSMPKEQQLFIRVPPSMADKDLVQKFFASYGKVLGVKVLQSNGPPPPDPNQRSFDPELTHFAFVVFDKEETAKGVLALYEKDPSRFKLDGVQLSVVAKTDKPKFDMSRGGGGGDGYYQQRSSPGPTGRGGGYGGGGGGAYQQHQQRYDGGGGGGGGGGIVRGRGRGGSGDFRGGRGGGGGHFNQSGAAPRTNRDGGAAGGGGRQ